MNRRAVRIGSHILSRRKRVMRDNSDLSSSSGELITICVSNELSSWSRERDGINLGEAKKADSKRGFGGERYMAAAPPASGITQKDLLHDLGALAFVKNGAWPFLPVNLELDENRAPLREKTVRAAALSETDSEHETRRNAANIDDCKFIKSAYERSS